MLADPDRKAVLKAVPGQREVRNDPKINRLLGASGRLEPNDDQPQTSVIHDADL
jgi:hypothetical protein